MNGKLIQAIVLISFSSAAIAQSSREIPESVDLSESFWRGSEVMRDNPHGLSFEDLFREPVDCSTIDADVDMYRGVFEDPSWPNGIIPIQFEPGLDPSRQAIFLEALAEVAFRTQIIFTRRSDETDYIYVAADPDFNFSDSVGRAGGRQNIVITSWNSKYIITHEIMHAIGFFHEQSAPDRDNFVVINTQNISQTACNGGSCNSQFAISENANVSSYYDYDSLMHYGRSAWSSNGQDTITTLDPSWQDLIGQRERISLGDQESLETMYGSPIFSSVWVLSIYGLPALSNGTLTFPDVSIINAFARVPAGPNVWRINIIDTHTQFISSPLTINKSVVLNGATLTIR